MKKAHEVLGKICFLVISTGQLIFGCYIIAFYYKSAIAGDFRKWNDVLPHGYVQGDWFGNFMMGIHVFLALVVVWGGPLQFFPIIRNRFPKFHRINGRFYLIGTVLVGLSGMIFTWARGSAGDTFMAITNTIQGVYIILFAFITIRLAIKGKIVKHEIWAFRLFIVSSGVWFFRVFLMAWILMNGGTSGFNEKTFTGPFLTFLSFFTYAFPVTLVVAEIYRFSSKRKNTALLLFSTVLILIAILILILGIAGAFLGMWLPNMQ